MSCSSLYSSLDIRGKHFPLSHVTIISTVSSPRRYYQLFVHSQHLVSLCFSSKNKICAEATRLLAKLDSRIVQSSSSYVCTGGKVVTDDLHGGEFGSSQRVLARNKRIKGSKAASGVELDAMTMEKGIKVPEE